MHPVICNSLDELVDALHYCVYYGWKPKVQRSTLKHKWSVTFMMQIRESEIKCNACNNTGINHQDEEGGRVEFYCDCRYGEHLFMQWIRENPEYA